MDADCSFNILLQGEQEWFVVPPAAFEPMMEKASSMGLELDHSTFQVPLEFWKKNEIPVFKILQKEGDAVIIHPGWTHSVRALVQE